MMFLKNSVKKSLQPLVRSLPTALRVWLLRELALTLGNHSAAILGASLAESAGSPPSGASVFGPEPPSGAGTQAGLVTLSSALFSHLDTSQQRLVFALLGSLLGERVAASLPAVLVRLSRAEQAKQFCLLAEKLGVSAAEVDGSNGTLAGYLEDRGVFIPYLCGRSWFSNAIALVNSVFSAHRGGTFLDVGANIGAVVVPVAKANPSVTCFAFEPVPANFLMLKHNIARNGLGNVHAFDLALGDVDGTMAFELDRANYGDHRVSKPTDAPMQLGEDQRAKIEVQARRLDGVLAGQNLARPLIAKMDVQGAELLVLAGGESTLRAADVLIVEYWPYGLRRLASGPEAFLRAFSGIFAFAAKVGEGPVHRGDFVPFTRLRAELADFANCTEPHHLNLILTNRAGLDLISEFNQSGLDNVT